MAVVEITEIATVPSPDPLIAPPEQLQERTRVARGIRIERLLAFLIPFAGFLPAAAELSLRYHSVIGDAASREANGYYVFFSNDPHLAAIGFVWNPLTTVTEMPLMLLKGIWPALTVDSFAAAIMSSVFMAGACYQFVRLMQDLGVRPIVRWGLLAVFVVDPMIFFYAANGMSEALFIFTLMAATRRLSLWLAAGQLRDLIVAGVWLALAYAARNEAAMAAGLAALVVLVFSYRRALGSVKQRRMMALTDAILFAAPFALSFVGWAAVSWVIVGHPFEQFSSVYGTSSQLKLGSINGGGASQPSKEQMLKLGIGGVVSLAPLLPIAAIGAATRAWRERDPRLLAILSVLGGIMLFEIASFSLGFILDSYRYLIYTIPLMVTLAAYLGRPIPKSTTEIEEERVQTAEGWTPPYLRLRRRQRRVLSVVAALGAVIIVVPGIFTAYREMFYTSLGAEESQQLAWILLPRSKAGLENANIRYQYGSIVAMAAALDALHAGKGGIMVDDADGCIPQVILASHHPAEFTIPNDVNYTDKFGDPYQFGIRYLLVSNPGAHNATLDSLDREWPTLYATGDGLGRMVKQTSLLGCNADFRLYQLFPQNIGQ